LHTELPVYAPLWRRVLAAFYDLLPLGALLMIGTACALVVAGMLAPDTRADLVLRAGWPHLALQCWLSLLASAYYVISWRKGGQTIGMRAWRIAVRADSGTLSLWHALLRLAFGLFAVAGWISCLFDARKRALHDLVAQTAVVHLPKR
jgi:uncharacterized RDD family membrane protein YckC